MPSSGSHSHLVALIDSPYRDQNQTEISESVYHAIEFRLISDWTADHRLSVSVVSHGQASEPLRPMHVQITLDNEFVGDVHGVISAF